MNVEALAETLIATRRSGQRLATLATADAPATADEAYAVQDAILRRLGIAIAGWKSGASNPTAEPQAGPILADRMTPSPATLALPPNALRTVEAELAFRFARDMPARATPYTDDEVWDAIDTLHVGIEVLESSFVDRRFVPAHAPLADLLNNGAYVYGPAIANWRHLELAHPVAVLIVNGKEIRRVDAGTPGGHPKRLLTFLVNHAARRGHPIKRGDIVTTGSHTGMYDAPAGATVIARFDGIGEASLTFA